VAESAWGHAIVTVAQDGTPLAFYFPEPRLGAPGGAERALSGERGARQLCVVTDLDQPPAGTGDAYLRLHLLSHRLVRPNSMNLDGIFKVLPNVCWTSLGPVAVSEIGAVRERALDRGIHLEVRSVDKFPSMLDYVVPSGVRVADGARVRLGAHLAEGTTVMHEGFVNFNAGTLGPAMVEGRIS
jgi:2,3,4,5-tetrahydropyridine-2-carboxylate N-succinyltransferase